MGLEPHQMDPGALDEDGRALRLRSEDGGTTVTVVDQVYGNRGGYLVVAMEDSPFYMLAHSATVAETFEIVDQDDEPDEPDSGNRLSGNYLNTNQPGDREPAPGPEEDRDEFANLTGADLDDALDRAGIDPSTGGSRADGSLTAEERRQALRDQYHPEGV